MRRSIVSVKGGFAIMIDGEKVGKAHKDVESAAKALKKMFSQ